MIYINLSWMIGIGSTYYYSNNQDLNLNDILNILREISDKSGTLSIEIVDPPEVGSQSLQINTEAGNFIIMLTDLDNNEDYDIRTYTNLCIEAKKINILGDTWDSKLICIDYDIVAKIMQDFLENGNVSKDLLN